MSHVDRNGGMKFSSVVVQVALRALLRAIMKHSHTFPSLVPRPFPPPVFDHFQYKNRGGRPGRKSHVHDVR